MAVENLTIDNMSDDNKNNARLNVLYSPFRRREVNPQDWESKMNFWKNKILSWCLDSNSCIFTLCKLQSTFVRNGRPASCLTTVLEEMQRNNEVIRLEELLSKEPSSQTWSSWALNCFVKTPIIWSFSKLKDSLVAKPESNVDDKYVLLAVLKKFSGVLSDSLKKTTAKQIISFEELKSILDLKDDLSVKVTLHWLQLQGQAAVATVNNKTIVKLSTSKDLMKPLTEADVGLYSLQQNEQALMQMLEQLEREKQEVEQEARNYLKKGMRQVAKSCLRKKKELEKCIQKRASALENVNVLLSRVKEAESDGEILDSYKMGLSALKATFKDAGLSEESVGHTMDQVQEVLEVHEEIQSALSEPMAASVDEDLENELAELLAGSTHEPVSGRQLPAQTVHKQQISLPDLPEPPTHSPTSSSIRTAAREAERPL